MCAVTTVGTGAELQANTHVRMVRYLYTCNHTVLGNDGIFDYLTLHPLYVRATPTPSTKSPLNVRTGLLGHLLPYHVGHQIFPDRSRCRKSHKPEPNIGEVCRRPDVRRVRLLHARPSQDPHPEHADLDIPTTV